MNKVKRTIHVGLCLFFAGSFSGIQAQPEAIPDRGPIPFSAYDRDGDGYISEGEFNSTRSERMEQRAAEGRPMRGAAGAPSFSGFDQDGDGRLTPDELAAGQQMQMQQRRGMQGEMAGDQRPSFSDFDLDGDGKVLEKEFYEARNQRISKRVEEGRPMKNLGNAPAFTDIDADGNGEISPEEFAAHHLQRRRQGME